MISTTTGKMRHRITIQNLVETADSMGGAGVETWIDYATVWCDAEPATGRESFLAGQQFAVLPQKFVIREIAGVKPKQQIVFEGKLFDIFSVGYTERGWQKEVVIWATQKGV